MSKKKSKRAKRVNPLAYYTTAKVAEHTANISMDDVSSFNVTLSIEGEVGRFVEDNFRCPPSLSRLAKYDCWLIGHSPNGGTVVLGFGTATTFNDFLKDCGEME